MLSSGAMSLNSLKTPVFCVLKRSSFNGSLFSEAGSLLSGRGTFDLICFFLLSSATSFCFSFSLFPIFSKLATSYSAVWLAVVSQLLFSLFPFQSPNLNECFLNSSRKFCAIFPDSTKLYNLEK